MSLAWRREVSGNAEPLALSSIQESAAVYPKWEGRGLGAVVMAVSLFVGYQLVFRYHTVMVDAWTRALAGLYVVLHGFHLAAIGFVWNPLPSLMSIPFAAARDLWPALMQEGFSSNIESAVFAAVGVYYLNKILWRFGFERTPRVLWSLLYAFNPLILLYSGNGMSDGMMCAATIACVEGVITYFHEERVMGLVSAGTWLAAGFMLRYESVPIGAALALGLFIAVRKRTGSWSSAQAAAITLVFPAVAAGIIWMILNGMIMHNPFFFADSHYSNSAQIASGTYNTPDMVAAWYHPLVAITASLGFSVLFWPFIPVAVVLGVLLLLKREMPAVWPLLFGAFAVPAFQAMLLWDHKSAEWDRFFIYYIPFGFVLCGLAIAHLGARLRQWIPVAVCLLLVAGDFVTWQALQSSVYGHGDNWVIQRLHGRASLGGESSNSYVAGGKEVSSYVNAHPKLKILLSTFTTFAAVPYVARPAQIVISNDSDYVATLQDPRGRINAILVAPNSVGAGLSRITRTYPTMWAGGVPWTRLIHQFPNGDRLYAVGPSAP